MKIDKLSLLIAVITTCGLILITGLFSVNRAKAVESSGKWWEVQSVDTMKYSRDLAREKLNDASFDEEINFQVKNISELGATHVAIGTPYDEEFLPFMRRWVDSARRHDLNIWFRGNFSGWEEWFEYSLISREDHLQKLEQFIVENPDLFDDGDIFTPCPECENGGPGDPRQNGDVDGHRGFLIEENETAKKAFEEIGRNVHSNYFSMNGDVAELVMDKATTKALGGIIVVDHYVATPEQLADDVKRYEEMSGGKVVLGEIGVPIPDIHGDLTQEEQAEWMYNALVLLSKDENILGMNYWVVTGGSTGLFVGNSKRKIADVVESFYDPRRLSLKITDAVGGTVPGAKVKVSHKYFIADNYGNVEILVPVEIDEFTISADGYKEFTQKIANPKNIGSISLEKERENILFRILKFIRSLFA